MLTIRTAQAYVQIREDLGAAVSSYDLADGCAVFRSASSASNIEFEMACNLMLPWCNRISDGGFYCNDVFYPLAANCDDDPSPLHGNGFQQVWQVAVQTESSVTLNLESESLEPFHYLAEVTYQLHGADLTVDLSVTNLSETRLPYGLGLHPWFIQESDTLLQAAAESVILMNETPLPVKIVPVSDISEWDFHQEKTLPKDGFDHCFTEWNQQATITWPSRNLQLSIKTDNNLPHCHIYSKNNQSDFFCFEPVSHPLNAHNWPDRSLSELTLLSIGEKLSACCTFSPSKY